MNFQQRDYDVGSFTSLRKLVSLDHHNLWQQKNVVLMFPASGIWASTKLSDLTTCPQNKNILAPLLCQAHLF